MKYEVMMLTDARRRVAGGWLQHSARDVHGRVCAGQALTDATHQVWTDTRGLDEAEVHRAADHVGHMVLQAIEELGQGTWLHIPDWNDDGSRTKTQVIEAFTRAIQIAEGDRPLTVKAVVPIPSGTVNPPEASPVAAWPEQPVDLVPVLTKMVADMKAAGEKVKELVHV